MGRTRRPCSRRAASITAAALVAVLAAACTATGASPAAAPPARSGKVRVHAPRAASARTGTPAHTAQPRVLALMREPAARRPLRILVVGDSVGQSLGAGIAVWGAKTGRAVVQNDAVPECSLGRALPRELPLGEKILPATKCTDWATRWAYAVDTFRPDLTVVMFSVWEGEPRELLGGRFARPGDPALDRWQLSEYRAAADVLTARHAPALWMNLACLGGAVTPGSPFWAVDYGTLPRLAASRPAVQVVDTNALLCPRGTPRRAFGDAPDVRPDGAHFSLLGAYAVARWLMPIVLGARPAPPRIFPDYRSTRRATSASVPAGE